MSKTTREPRFEGKVCIVTGGGSGIGQATCQAFAKEGAKVVAADKNSQSAQSTAAGIRHQGGHCLDIQTDVSQAVSVQAMVDHTLAALGRIDVLVNNAGFGFAATVMETDESDWDRIMSVNLKGVYLGCKYTVPVMIQQGGGSIINTASAAGVVVVPDRVAYCASKGGVIAMTRAMALDHVKHGIRINCIAPGAVESPYFEEIFAKATNPLDLRNQMEQRHPVGRFGTPSEIAQGILYLASDESSFVTGSTLNIDGGMTAQ